MMKFISKIAIATWLAAFGLQLSAHADELACTAIETTPDGKFTYSLRPELKVLAEVEKHGAPVFDVPAATVALSCIRDQIVPVENDIEVLQAGYIMMITDSKKRMISLSLEDGQISYKISSGELSKRKQRKIGKVVAQMQARID